MTGAAGGAALDGAAGSGARARVTDVAQVEGAQIGAAQLGRSSLGNTPLPCELDAVLATSCQGCHGAEPGAQAPMALVTHEDLMAPSISDPSRAVHELVDTRVHDHAAPMPPSSSRALTDDELAVIERHVAAGMPAGEGSCAAGAIGEVERIAPAEAEVDRCYALRAHGQPVAGDATPYMAETGEYYSCFYFDIPWEGQPQAITLRSLDTPITHHWMLFDTAEAYEPGAIVDTAPNCGVALREVLGAFGVGQQREQHMPPGVGLQLPSRGSGHGLLLELHYSNPGAPVEDAAGVEVCTAKTPREHVAGISTLGTSLFALAPGAQQQVKATCTPQYAGEIHIMRAFPHMHRLGVRIDARIERRDGSFETLFDIAYDVNNQRIHDTPALLHPGDRIHTTCHYENDTDQLVFSGYGSHEEMCNNFLYAWPAGALSNATVDNGTMVATSTPCLL